MHLLSFTGLFEKSAQSDSTLILNTEVRFCPENFGLNSGEIYSDPGRNSSDTQEGNQRKRNPGREICVIKARTTRTIWSERCRTVIHENLFVCKCITYLKCKVLHIFCLTNYQSSNGTSFFWVLQFQQNEDEKFCNCK